jgi:hypothetical protein
MEKLLIALTFAVLPMGVFAQVPEYDVEAACVAQTEELQQDQAFTATCLTVEEESRGNLEKLWPTLSPDLAQACIENNEDMGLSYVLLESCIQMVLDSGASSETE